MPVSIPDGASVSLESEMAIIKGPKGQRSIPVPDGLSVSVQGKLIVVARDRDDRQTRALHGTIRSELYNAVVGVTALWRKELELVGVGYRAAMSGANLVLTVGFSHPVIITPPPDITLSVVEGNVVVSGVDKQLVGEVAAKIRAVKKPEPYKGKGIKYVGERIRRKPGKSAKAVGGAPGAT